MTPDDREEVKRIVAKEGDGCVVWIILLSFGLTVGYVIPKILDRIEARITALEKQVKEGR